MSEVTKDPTMRLFGKTIQLTPKKQLSGDTHHNLLSSTNSSPSERNYNRVGDTKEDSKKPSENELSNTELEDSTSHPTPKESKDPETSCENPKTPSLDKESDSSKDPKTDEQSENSISQEEKALKKPEKIIPCPRCNSMDTKFCYYNNYNVSQPRHFCKNCQRYWTAGGTMRNVPVGSGRRKNKGSSASHYPHITVSEALQVVQSNTAVNGNGNGIHHPNFSTNGTVLNFGLDSPVCESMTCASDLAEKSQKQKSSVSCGGNENGDDYSSRSSITASDFAEKGGKSVLQESVMTNFQNLPPQVQCFPGQPWPCHWNSPSGFPITFYPAPPYWGCAMPGSWNLPWISPPPNSPTLGKHSRDGDMLQPSKSDIEEPSKENNSERGIWIPKTLRIDDPSEAAKSSIWSTLGIKNEKSDSIKRGSLFKAFQSKGDEKKHVAEMTLVMQANPAALSRSLNFHERA